MLETSEMASHPSSDSAQGGGMRRRSILSKILHINEIGVLLALAVLVIVMSIASPYFLTANNLLSIARQMSMVAIIGAGMTFLIITREFDLSVGSIVGLSGIVTAIFCKNLGLSIWLSMVIGLLVGMTAGLINGLLSTKVGIPSFIVTLGMLSMLRGLALIFSGGWPISGMPQSMFSEVFSGIPFAGIPAQAIWMVGILLLFGILLARGVYGYKVYATGSNPKAANLSGINNDRVKIINFMLVGLLAAFAGQLSLSQLDSVSPLTGGGMELDVIASVVIGGTALAGGSGTVLGTFLGAAIISIVRNGLVLLGVSAYWQQFAIGAVIVISVTTDGILRRIRKA